MEAEATTPRAFAATWRDQEGAVVSTTWGGTMCWFPRLPWRLRIVREGFEHVVRCGECPGCLEFERRRLADRLNAKYGAHGEQLTRRARQRRSNQAGASGEMQRELFIFRIYAPVERHAKIAHALHRRPSLELEPGLFRLGVSSFAVLARDRAPLVDALRALHLENRVERIRFSRGRRAWRALTSGLAVSREAYGEHVKRWYVRGLPPAAREKFEVVKIGTYKTYNRWRAPRAWQNGNLVLVPPEVWQLRRVDRRKLHDFMRSGRSPEFAQALSNILAQINLKSPSVASSQTDLSPRRGAPSNSITPTSEVGGYRSSVHSQGEFFSPPRRDEDLDQAGDSGDPVWMERERERAMHEDAVREGKRKRALDESLAIIERMRKLAEKRSRDG